MKLRLIDYTMEKTGKRKKDKSQVIRDIHEFVPLFRQDGCLCKAHSIILSKFLKRAEEKGLGGAIDLLKGE